MADRGRCEARLDPAPFEEAFIAAALLRQVVREFHQLAAPEEPEAAFRLLVGILGAMTADGIGGRSAAGILRRVARQVEGAPSQGQVMLAEALARRAAGEGRGR